MRITNVMGAIIVFFIAIVLDYGLLVPTMNWIEATTTGTAQIILMVGAGIVFMFITIALPIMIAVEDQKNP